jgi:hypothetical protein
MTTTQRGYGTTHQQRRKTLMQYAYGCVCQLCNQMMVYPQPLDLDHSTPLAHDPYAQGDRIVHASCNRAKGARAA